MQGYQYSQSDPGIIDKNNFKIPIKVILRICCL